MKTIRVEQPGEFTLYDSPEPGAPGPGEALVRVRRVGVCGTDYHAFRGKQPFFTYPRILGHELGVEIAAIGPNPQGLAAGDLCAVEPYLTCGVCIACRNGKTNCCVKLQCMGVHVDGGMRELITVPVAKLHRSRKLTVEQLALVEMLGIGAHAVQRAALQPGEKVLVVGAGPIGLSAVEFAQIAGAEVIVMDVNASRLAFCREKLKARHTVLLRPEEGGDAEAAARIRELTNGDMPTAVFEATGNPGSMAKSIHLCASGGRLIFIGLFQGDYTFNDPDFHRRELTLLASRNSTGDDFRRIIALMENGTIDTRPWITHRTGCESMIGQFNAWMDPKSEVVKAMVEF